MPIKNRFETKKIEDIFLETSAEKLNQPKLFSKPKKVKTLIEITNLTKKFGKNKNTTIALKNINLKINDNENLALLGANGAGKTTLVEIICGINKPTDGNIKINYDFKNSYQEKIGIQFQDSLYPSGLKVKDIVNFITEVYDTKIPKEEIQKMVQMFGLKSYWNKLARSLSGGQQQRLNILLALINKPKLLFLDELSTGLDISVREQIKKFVYQLCKQYNINIILISHDVNEINELCNRIVIMQKGEIRVDMYKEDIIKKFKNVETLLKRYI